MSERPGGAFVPAKRLSTTDYLLLGTAAPTKDTAVAAARERLGDDAA